MDLQKLLKDVKEILSIEDGDYSKLTDKEVYAPSISS